MVETAASCSVFILVSREPSENLACSDQLSGPAVLHNRKLGLTCLFFVGWTGKHRSQPFCQTAGATGANSDTRVLTQASQRCNGLSTLLQKLAGT